MVNMNLLQYNVYNVKYSFELRHANITTPTNQPTSTQRTNMAELSVETTDSRLSVDSSRFYASLGMTNMDEFMDKAAERGRQAVLEKTGEYASDRRKLGEIDTGVTPAALYEQKFFSDMKTTLTLARTGPIKIYFSKPDIDISYRSGSVSHNWDVGFAARRYTPSDFTGSIEQYPRIEFSYTGDPLLFPNGTGRHIDRRV